MDSHDMSHRHHGEIKDRKGSACDQYGADEQVVDGLFSLKLHHAPRDDIAVRILPVRAPAVDDSVQHHHIESHKDGCIEEIEQGGRIPAEQVHVDIGRLKSADSAHEDQDQADRPAPSAQIFHGLVFVFLVDHVDDVCPFQIAAGCHAGEGDHDHEEDSRQAQTFQIQPQMHLRAVHDQQPEAAPQQIHERKTGDDAKQRGDAA